MKFKLGEKKKVFEGKFLTVWEREFLDKAGKPGTWEFVEKSDVVFILPITNEGNIILEKIYRVPLEEYVIEPPAGLLDKKGEDREAAARRELLEETGYEAEKLYALPTWPYRTGTSENRMYGFIATGLTKINSNSGDETEDIELMEIPHQKLVRTLLDLKDKMLFEPEILAMYQLALEMGIIR